MQKDNFLLTLQTDMRYSAPQLCHKKRMLILLMLLLALRATGVMAGDGSESSPYSVAEMISHATSTTKKLWVRGYVVGELQNYSNNKWFIQMSPPFDGSVYLLADTHTETDLKKCLCVQFPISSVGGEEYSLEEHPEFWRRPIRLQGTREQYNNMAGMKKISAYEWLDADVFSDESRLWNFYETFESGTFTAASDDKWLGGVYERREYADKYDYEGTLVSRWQLTNAILDDGKPKWDDKAVSLRNQNATIEQLTDCTGGLGEIEFWAGNYEDYSAYQLAFSVLYSTDQGRTWNTLADNIQLARPTKATTNGMTLYRFLVNRPAPVRIKIVKTDSNVGKGIQIDDIKMSRYGEMSASLSTTPEEAISITVRQGEAQITCAGTHHVRIYTTDGLTMTDCVMTNTLCVQLPRGCYVVKTGRTAHKLIVP
ncbi:MAG: hypothetical protein IJ680_02020 [Paludibacteraceae bacterium]|nr:hypothetical protein [Paludibacteraceae bacterium]